MWRVSAQNTSGEQVGATPFYFIFVFACFAGVTPASSPVHSTGALGRGRRTKTKTKAKKNESDNYVGIKN
jgi:hypothetical protein